MPYIHSMELQYTIALFSITSSEASLRQMVVRSHVLLDSLLLPLRG